MFYMNKYSKLFNNSSGFTAITDIENGKFIEVNDSFCRLTGFSREELIGYSSFELGILSEEIRNKLKEDILNNNKIESIEKEIIDRSGEKHIVLISADLLTLNSDSYILTSGVDITQNKKAEEELRKSENNNENNN